MIPLRYNLRSLRQRKVASILTAIGIALVTAIFVSLLALGQGVRKTMVSTGHPQNLIVMRDGPTAETQSSIDLNDAEILKTLAGITPDADGAPMASPETIVIVSEVKPDGGNANLILRGVGPMAWKVRPDLKIDGRWPNPERAEAVVGLTLSRRFPDLRLGARKAFKKVEYEIVGVFDAQGRAYESEIWVSGDQLRPEFGRPYSSVVVRADDPAALAAAIDAEARFPLKAHDEVEYFRKQTEMAGMIEFMATVVALVLGIGAGFGAAITMYASVAARVREIATLRVLGFGRFGIGVGFLLESAMIALPGGALGAMLALPLNGMTTGTTNWETFSEMAFNFTVTPELMGIGVAVAALLGMAGGFFPAISATRIPIARALREI